MGLLVSASVSFILGGSLVSAASNSAGNNPENPSAADFLRRAYHSSVILGNYLYIDGGEISQKTGGMPSHSRLNRVTLSIDLTSEWTNASLRMQSIPKGAAPSSNGGVLWKTPDQKSFFAWGGGISSVSDGNIPPLKVWNFTSDKSGGGSWTEDTTSSTSMSKAQVIRLVTGSYTAIRDTGYYVGGLVNGQTDVSAANDPDTPQQGITTFNFTSEKWTKESSIGLNDFGTSIASKTVSIPAFGSENRGLLFVLGGKDPGLTAQGKNADLVPLSNITIYNPYIEQWSAQRATGDVPLARTRFCAASVKGDNGTYEIFIYGGLSSDISYDEIYVLSIPGFVWLKASYTPLAPRFEHTCEVAGGRQLISIGGLNSNGHKKGDYLSFWKSPDPFKQGIGVFDMTTMAWKSSYDPNASKYETPVVIKQWYSDGGLAQVQWQNKEVARMFVQDVPGK
ncbi:hypothetical protein BJ875DRAFT_418229 [Amylocarpus encephaloides]|uniref:Kelch repeat protein n=1 Tax=Amylocarpus encephaloides TaxID=45428 RepID=A0A9P8C9S0_9HELO|nr:hypothetical protein BJ875DRAFT_418229 [Amylocarpus encephaloides]